MERATIEDQRLGMQGGGEENRKETQNEPPMTAPLPPGPLGEVGASGVH